MSRILLTGATGFIGRHVLDVFVDAGHDVHAIARTPDTPRSGVSWYAGDLLVPGTATELVRRIRPDRLVHLAWTTTPGIYWNSPENLSWAVATLELHNAFADVGGVRAVYAGTCAEYDWSVADLEEDRTPLLPKTLYGIMKATTATQLLAAQFRGGPGVAWGRVFYLYGPGEGPGRLVSDVVTSLLAGRPIDCTDGRQQRDFMHVTDVARAFLALTTSDVRGAFNIASGQCVSIRSIVDEIGRQTERADLLRIGARPSSPDDPPRLATKAAPLRAIGFVPHCDLTAGLSDTIAWWRTRMANSK